MKNKMTTLMLAASLATLYSCSGDNSEKDAVSETVDTVTTINTAAGSDKDIKFAMDAAEGGILEVKLGELAKERAVTKSVKNYGDMLLHDHGVANDELKALAESKKITVPATLSEDKQKMYDDLAKKTGADFDKSYIDMMVSDHKDDIDAFKDEAKDGNDQQLKTWADGKVITLQMHLDRAQAIQDSLKKAKI